MQYSAKELSSLRLSKKFVDFNILLIGENGIGKKSFINTLCEQQVFQIQDEIRDNSQFRIATDECVVKREFPIRLTINRTVNFGFNLNNSANFSEIVQFLDDKFENKLKEETKISRTYKKKEEVVHLIILFVGPNLKGLKPIEVEVIKLIEDKCNLLICVGKCDLLNYPELMLQRKLINESIEGNKLKMFNFDVFLNDPELDDEFKEYYKDVKKMLPFSVITANDNLFSKRFSLNYSVDVNKFSDFKLLRDLIFNLNLMEFKELTNKEIYEVYRTDKLLNS